MSDDLQTRPPMPASAVYNEIFRAIYKQMISIYKQMKLTNKKTNKSEEENEKLANLQKVAEVPKKKRNDKKSYCLNKQSNGMFIQ